MEEEEEAVLVERLMAKDPRALEHLYGVYYDRVKAVVRRLIRDEADVEEVAQDTFWTVYRKIHLFRQDSALWSWMYRIAVNAAKMRIRTYHRNPIPMEDEILRAIQVEESVNNRNSRPDEQLAVKRLMAEMEVFLAECNETNRAVYVGMELDGLEKEEIARQLDLTVPAVKTRLHRLRAGLRERLAPMYDGAGEYDEAA